MNFVLSLFWVVLDHLLVFQYHYSKVLKICSSFYYSKISFSLESLSDVRTSKTSFVISVGGGT